MRVGIPVLLVVVLCCVCAAGDVHHNDSWYTDIPRGDAQRCPQSVHMMEALPGLGFDNLNNREMALVLAVNYSLCRVSPDRKYLLPDNVEAVPVKSSRVNLFSHMMDHWQNYSSMTDTSINVGASGHFFFGGISGSFSQDHQTIKKNMIHDNTVTVRAQLRHTFYSVQAQPDSRLSPRCEARLLDIASYLQRNDSYQSTYLSQLFVRDFGTHYTKQVEAGAIVAQTDQISSHFVEKFDEAKSKITASASASFFSVFSISGSYSHSTDTKTTTEYLNNRKHSTISTIGGPPFRANYTLNDWEDGLENALVPVDRNGDPIWYVITKEALPQLPDDTIQQLVDVVKEAVRQYYLHNLHRGCTNKNAKNFSPQANFDDGQCEPPNTNYTFGGVYQTCDGPSDFCSKNRQVNPKTRGYSCSSPYKAQLLYSFTGPRECRQDCHGWWIFRSCDWHCTQGVVNAYWCYATHNTEKDTGYLFGGVYTDHTVNFATQDKSCPKMFYPLKIVEGYVCVSDDYEMGYQYSYPFGGFMSCDYGNPLSENLAKGYQAKPNSLRSFFQEQKKGSSPKHCPKGYSQHLMQISHGCEINYCVQKNAFSDARLPVLKRPPFVNKPVPITNDTMYLLTKAGKVMKRLDPLQWVEVRPMEEIRLQQKGPPPEPTSQSGISMGGTVALTMFGTIVAALMIWAGVVIVTKYRDPHGSPYRLRDDAPVATYSAHVGDPAPHTETSRLVV